jgi:hypothetical protein
MTYVAPCFYPLADVRWRIPDLDTSSLATRKKSHGLPIYKPNLFQIKRNVDAFRFWVEEPLQLQDILRLDSATESEGDEPVLFGSSNLQHRLAL